MPGSSPKTLSEARSLIAAYSGTVGVVPKVHTRGHTTTEYSDNLLSGTFYSGISFVQTLINTSGMPDLAASISGWGSIDLSTKLIVVSQDTADLLCHIEAVGFGDLTASMRVMQVSDISALVNVNDVVSLSAAIVAVGSSSLSVSVEPIPFAALCATMGGHLPEDLSAQILPIAPSGMSAWLRVATSASPVSLSSTIVATGGFFDVAASIITTAPGSSSIGASIRTYVSKDLTASVYSFVAADVLATISSNFSNDLRAIIKGTGFGVSDLFTRLICTDHATAGFTCFIRATISTHTSSKSRNIESFSRTFPGNIYAFSSVSLGLSLVSIEPIFGTFPDMAAVITALAIPTKDIGALIRGIRVGSLTDDISSCVFGVTPVITISRAQLNFVLFRSLSATITPIGHINSFGANIKSLTTAQTGTAADAGYSYTTNVVRQFLATSIGLVVFEPKTSVLKTGSYTNSHLLPDLHSSLSGWDVLSLSVSIKALAQSDLGATIFVFDASRMKTLAASITSFVTTDVSATISATGGFSDISSLITVVGKVEEMQAQINGYVGFFGRETLDVYTKPFSNLGATINFDPAYSCSISSGFASMGSYIVGAALSNTDIFASIQALHDQAGLGASIYGLKRIRYKMLTLFFRAATRDSEPLGAIISCWSRENTTELTTSIQGMHFTSDLATTIAAVRYKPSFVYTAESVLLVNVRKPSIQKTAEVLFGTGVDSYIFDSLESVLYSSSGEAWSVLVRTIDTVSSFYDYDTSNRERFITNITDFDSFDEAIRYSLMMLSSMESSDCSASITATGGYLDMTGRVVATELDKVSDIRSKISVVANLPDISALVSVVGYFTGVKSSITSLCPSFSGVSSSISGWGESNVSAIITCI